jgi:hypothetical protein
LSGNNLPPIGLRQVAYDWITHLCTLSKIKRVKYNLVSLDEYKSMIESVNTDDLYEFHRIIILGFELLPISKEELRNRFDMSVPSLERWLTGASAPHPIMRKHVIKFFKDKLTNAAELPSDNG